MVAGLAGAAWESQGWEEKAAEGQELRRGQSVRITALGTPVLCWLRDRQGSWSLKVKGEASMGRAPL